MNFLQICKAVRRECGIQGSGPTATTGQTGVLERVVEWVKEADLDIQRLHPDWGFLWAEWTDDTVLGDDDLTEPTDLGAWDVESFARDRGTTSGQPIREMSFEEWRANNYSRSNQEPNRICILPDNSLKLEFPADDVYEIYANYWKQPSEMSGDSDTPLYDSEFHRIVVARAKMFFFEDREAWNSYQAALVEFDGGDGRRGPGSGTGGILAKMRARYLPNRRQTSLESSEIVIRPE